MASSVSAYSSTAPRPSNLLWLHPGTRRRHKQPSVQQPSAQQKFRGTLVTHARPTFSGCTPAPVVATNNLLSNNLQHNRSSEALSSHTPVKPSLSAPAPVVATNNLLSNHLQHNISSEAFLSQSVFPKMTSKRSICLPALTPEELALTPRHQFFINLNGWDYTYVVPTGRAACAYCGITSISFGAMVKHQSKCNKNPAYQEKVSNTSELPNV
jgi:hypothetical protein